MFTADPELFFLHLHTVVPMSQSPWTYSAAMELPLTRSLNSSSSESSIDSGFESPLGKGSGSPVSRVSTASLSDAISTTSTLTNMLVRSGFVHESMCTYVTCVCMLSVGSLNVHAIVKHPPCLWWWQLAAARLYCMESVLCVLLQLHLVTGCCFV